MIKYLLKHTEKLRRQYFEKQLAFGVFFLNLFGDQNKCVQLKKYISELPPNTLGHRLYHEMQKHQFDFVPYYESHDLKHIALGYEFKMEDEIRMQAFMFGNSGFSIWSLFMFSLFIVLVPESWSSLPYHYRIGKHCKPIANWTVTQVAAKNLQELRQEIGWYDARLLAHINGHKQRNFFYN